MTNAQLELMCADVPLTVYPKDNKKAKDADGRRQFREMDGTEIESKRREYADLVESGRQYITINAL